MRADWGRWAALTGVPFAVLYLIAVFATGSTPSSNATAQHAVSFFTAHRTGQRVSTFLIAYAVIFAVFFGASLRSYLKARSDGDGLITVGFSGIVIFAVGACTLVGMTFAAADVPGKISPAAEQALNVLQNDTFFAFLGGTAIFLIGNGLAIVASGALPAWLGWIALPLAVAAVTPIGWLVAIFVLPVWVLIVAVLMFLRSAQAAAPSVVQAAAS